MAEYTREQIITQMYKANSAGNKEAERWGCQF